ncbi:phosphoinositide phosphatase SAC2-like [Iris pallida]|uniref:Phosphoinositide phosphatase SAC2-like n=1 Tax=Iris pallida TaxID=29817 RepID=A0AAX6FL11_IRIPA|nr:phosphoinositide phosphatase SAC2-like [Iris pallida]
MFQKGVLRTNCIDCLDRTNVAQYAYGLAALGHQLYALGFIDVQKVDLESSLADELMCFYERMGDVLALQYGGSAAHKKIFSERRGQWKAATQSQELLRTLQRYYSNAYMDAEKQDAINVFLGHFQPHRGKPALWELDSDQHYNIGRRGRGLEGNMRSFKRSLSDGNILCESNTPVCDNVGEREPCSSTLPSKWHIANDAKGLSDSRPEISTYENEICYSRFNPIMSPRDGEHNYFKELRFEPLNCSNFLESDWISSSGNSCEDECYERSSLINSPITALSTESVIGGMTPGTATELNGTDIKGAEIEDAELPPNTDVSQFSKNFIDWVLHGEAFCY